MVGLQKQDIWEKKKNFPYILFFGSKQNPVAYINKKDILESLLLRCLYEPNTNHISHFCQSFSAFILKYNNLE